MDKEEYHQKLDELTAYVREKDYENALSIVDSIDWRRVKSINTLNMVADVYEVNKDYESAKDILVLAYSRASIGRNILYRLVEVCIRLNQIDEAEKYFREFSKVAKNDNSRCLLQYKLFKAKGAPLEAQIDVLEEYKEREYTERWAYELAVLYSKAGDTKKCVETCDDLILWFSEGRYVMKAMELKKQYAALTPSQEQNYNRMKAAANRRKQEQSAGVASEDTESTEEDASARAGIFKEEEREVPESSSFVKRDRNRGEAAGSLESDNQVSGRGKRSEQEHPAESAAVEFKDRLEKGFHHVMHSFTEEGKTVDSGRNRDENVIVDSRRNSGQHAGSDLRRTSDAGRTADTERASDEDLRSDFGRSTDGSQASRVGGSARPSNNPELKQQNSVSERKLTPAAAAAEKARREGTSRKMNTGDFNLDAFLAETAGSFSSEIAAGAAKSETTGDAKAEAPTKAEGAARDAVPVEETEAVEIETPKAEAEIVEEKVSDRTGVKNGTRFEEAEVVEEESPEEAEVVEEESPEEAEAVEEESPEEAEVVEEESPEEAEVVEEESPEEAEAVEEESPEEAETVEGEVPEATEKSKNLAGGIRLRDLEEEDLSREVTPETLKTGAGTEGAAAGTGSVPSEEVRTDGTSADADSAKPKKKEIHYIEELEIPDPQPSEAERASHTHTIPLDTIGANTVPISIDKILSEETPEERRIRIMNRAKPTRMNEEQRKIFTYFARIPGMDAQILEAISCVYEHAGEKTSLHGNIAVMGARGTGKTRLTHGLVVAMCKDLGMDAAKVARVRGADLNEKDPARVVARMAGGFFIIEDVSGMNEATVEKLSQAMEFRTDCMITIIEDEKVAMRAFLKKYPRFAAKFDRVISIPVFTNDELITFARTYATENGYKIDDMAILALYTMIGNMQTEEEPVTISIVKDMIDKAISHSSAKRRRSRKNKKDKWLVLQEKDFNLT